jgi:hypothetical protein
MTHWRIRLALGFGQAKSGVEELTFDKWDI